MNFYYRRSPATCHNTGFHHNIILFPLPALITFLVDTGQNLLKCCLFVNLFLINSGYPFQGRRWVHHHILIGRKNCCFYCLRSTNIGNHGRYQVYLVRTFATRKRIIRQPQHLSHHSGISCFTSTRFSGTHKHPHRSV